ncbi:unnamed protein product, partial [Fusarium graminearum]
ICDLIIRLDMNHNHFLLSALTLSFAVSWTRLSTGEAVVSDIIKYWDYKS